MEKPQLANAGSVEGMPDEKVPVEPAGTPSSGAMYYVEPVNITPLAASVETQAPTKQLFQLRGGGSSIAELIDSRGNVVMDPYPYNTIAGYSASPNGGQILIYHGNSDYEIFDPETKSRAILPKQPSGGNKIAFSAWHWIDDNTLLGTSGDELETPKKLAGEDTTKIKGRLYLYTLSNRELVEAHLPKTLGTRIFSVSQVGPNGYVHLFNEDPNTKRSPDLGWFQVRSK